MSEWVSEKSLSRVRLFATPWTVAHQAPTSIEFSRQEYWSGLAFPSPLRANNFLQTKQNLIIALKIKSNKQTSCFSTAPCMRAMSLQLCLTLCDPMECSLPGSSVHGIFQARILEWVAVCLSRRSSRPRDWTHGSYVSCIGRRVLYQSCHLGSLHCTVDSS